ncbi:MAG: enoyl-ACP reductase [Alphaproteobacteria bacterium]|nr:enoyl-ACP reductase [Alphaproteobacteria bacterium]
MDLLKGKKGLITGVANDKSIAWGIAKDAHAAGAQLAFTYYGEPILRRIKPLAEQLGSSSVYSCDLGSDDDMQSVMNALEKDGPFDFVLHSVAYTEKEALRGRYVDTTRKNFQDTLNISAYSLTSLCQHLHNAKLLAPQASVVTLSYYGAEKVVPNYNVMGVAKAALEASVRYLAMDLGIDGVRVNALSAGPMRTVAAFTIGDFPYILDWNKNNAPLNRNITMKDVGSSAIYLFSDLSSAVTGETHHVDAGYHVVGLRAVRGSVKDLKD